MKIKLSKPVRNKLFKGETITIKPSHLSEGEGYEYFTPGHANKIMRRISKGKGIRTKLTQADFKHLMSKKMEGAGFRDWLQSLRRKAKNTVSDIKNLAKGDANTWKKIGMKAANFAVKKALPTSKIPGLNKLAEAGIDRATKKIAERAGIEGLGHGAKTKKISFKESSGEGIADDVTKYVKKKGKEFVLKKGQELKNKAVKKGMEAKDRIMKKAKQGVSKAKKIEGKLTEKANEAEQIVRDRVDDISRSNSNLKLTLQKLASEVNSRGEGLYVDRANRGNGLYVSRGGAIRNIDLVNKNGLMVNPGLGNFSTDFLSSGHQAMNPLSSQVYYGDHMTNSLFSKLSKNTATNSDKRDGDGTPLNPHFEHSDFSIRF